jgi:NADP-dependent 3-hydroxy acid dehydrogenase YdfG
MQPLAQRTAVVTGASSGIGAATARALAGAGARLVLVARRRERLAALTAELPGARWVEADVRDAAALERALADVPCDVLVANAGLALGVERLPGGDPEEWSIVLDTNVKGVLNALHAVVPGMARRGTGDVVLLGSVAGRQVYPGGNVYCASKWAVRALYEALRVDMQDSGLRFTTVDPGLVETDFSLVRHKGDRERAGATYAGFEPLRPEDVAEAILWAVTRPPRVNVGEIVLWPSAQSSTTHVRRAGAKA